MVNAHALQFHILAVQEEAVIRIKSEGSQAEGNGLLVRNLSFLQGFSPQGIQERIRVAPAAGLCYAQGQAARLSLHASFRDGFSVRGQQGETDTVSAFCIIPDPQGLLRRLSVILQCRLGAAVRVNRLSEYHKPVIQVLCHKIQQHV